MKEQWESQVWQRVRQPMAASGENLRVLRRESMGLAGIYRKLENTLRGRSREQAAVLYRQELENEAILRGLERLSGGDSGPMRPVPPPEEGTARLQSRPARLKEGISMAKCSRPVSTALNVMRPVSDMTS